MTASVLIATPCYAGNIHIGYFRTCLNVLETGIDVNFLVTEGESNIARARSNMLGTFMRSDYETLAFIDADIEMSGTDFARLANMDGVRGAAVNCKSPDFSENLSVLRDGQRVRRSEMPAEPFSVDYLGSAVLFIDRDVIQALVDAYPESAYDDPIVGESWYLFPDIVRERALLTEDYGFCALCRDQGIEIVCDPAVIVRHYGTACWSA